MVWCPGPYTLSGKHVFLRVLYKRMERTLVKFLHSGDPDMIAEDHALIFGKKKQIAEPSYIIASQP
jgi:hypothetical protein